MLHDRVPLLVVRAEPARFAFRVLAPWYERGWALAMFALIGALILALTLMPVLCSYFLRGWEAMSTMGTTCSYRLMWDPLRDACLPVPVFNRQMLRDGIIE